MAQMRVHGPRLNHLTNLSALLRLALCVPSSSPVRAIELAG